MRPHVGVFRSALHIKNSHACYTAIVFFAYDAPHPLDKRRHCLWCRLLPRVGLRRVPPVNESIKAPRPSPTEKGPSYAAYPRSRMHAGSLHLQPGTQLSACFAENRPSRGPMGLTQRTKRPFIIPIHYAERWCRWRRAGLSGLVSLKGGLRMVVIRQLRILGRMVNRRIRHRSSVGFPIPKYDAQTGTWPPQKTSASG